ncbi:hypothetical protein NUW58_g4998 [Xylaria curta]|uniref:Uncharacterized protein n=1 Tax=Xylaria curta TaxID=42375 RepID=A0ACC1P615_9PEZI|nr:hypothetical protein NUW58_g4998 [Xylaria curta]
MPADIRPVKRASSQRAADLYRAGVPLWNKEDLLDIEHELAQSYTLDKFTIRRIDGSKICIQNPMKPYVHFQDYWRLVKAKPDGPPETYHCSYLVNWSNETLAEFRGTIEHPKALFEQVKLAWENSATCNLLRCDLTKFLGTKKVTKIVCFGLGDLHRKPPEWLTRMIQHSIALTIADFCRHGSDEFVRLLSQDPDYTEQTKEILTRSGFEIVGQYGAGGFAEIDDETVVFSVFVNAPVKQIIADIARPLLVISTGFEICDDHENPWADADSPRTRRMWQEYGCYDFPVSPEESKTMAQMQKLKIYARTAAERIDL